MGALCSTAKSTLVNFEPSYDINNKWYIVEKIKGITVSSLYVNELLTTDTLIHIMNTIKRLQNINNSTNSTNINIYSNYADKLKSRYESYNYDKFINHKEIFNLLYTELKNYELNNYGKCVIMHGDLVMTNILINNYTTINSDLLVNNLLISNDHHITIYSNLNVLNNYLG